MRRLVFKPKRIICLLVTVMAMVFLSQRMAIASPSAQWEKTFGGSAEDNSYHVRQTSDGGYILVGATNSYGAGDYDVYLVKADSNGNEVWHKTFGGGSRDVGHSVEQTSDGGYIVAGYFNWEQDACLIKTDPNGNLVWQKTYGGGGMDDIFTSVQQTSDGGYIVTGMTNSYGAGDLDVWLVKTDSDGNEVWDANFGGSDKEHANWVEQTSDGGYIIAGDTRSYGTGSFDVYLIKTDSGGNLQWQKTFGGTASDSGYCVQQTNDCGYIVTGITNYLSGSDDVYLIKTGSDGNSVWEKTFGGSCRTHGMEVQQTFDGGYIVAGYTNCFGAGSNDGYLIKTDSAGNLEWDKTFGGELSDTFASVQQTSDGGYIAAGITYSYGAGNSDAYLVKLEPPEPNIAVSPLSHDFGDVELGTSSTVVVTISNVGNGDLTVSDIALETDFAITSVPPASVVVKPDETVDVEITYTPTVLGYNSAVLKIASDDPDEPVVEVALGAVGIEIPLPPSEQIANILAFFDTSVEEGTLAGDGPSKSAEKRLNALRNMLNAAGDLIEHELFQEACQQLLDAYKKTDGQLRPPDFVKGEAAPELANMIQALRTSLGCE